MFRNNDLREIKGTGEEGAHTHRLDGGGRRRETDEWRGEERDRPPDCRPKVLSGGAEGRRKDKDRYETERKENAPSNRLSTYRPSFPLCAQNYVVCTCQNWRCAGRASRQHPPLAGCSDFQTSGPHLFQLSFENLMSRKWTEYK